MAAPRPARADWALARRWSRQNKLAVIIICSFMTNAQPSNGLCAIRLMPDVQTEAVTAGAATARGENGDTAEKGEGGR